MPTRPRRRWGARQSRGDPTTPRSRRREETSEPGALFVEARTRFATPSPRGGMRAAVVRIVGGHSAPVKSVLAIASCGATACANNTRAVRRRGPRRGYGRGVAFGGALGRRRADLCDIRGRAGLDPRPARAPRVAHRPRRWRRRASSELEAAFGRADRCRARRSRSCSRRASSASALSSICLGLKSGFMTMVTSPLPLVDLAGRSPHCASAPRSDRATANDSPRQG